MAQIRTGWYSVLLRTGQDGHLEHGLSPVELLPSCHLTSGRKYQPLSRWLGTGQNLKIPESRRWRREAGVRCEDWPLILGSLPLQFSLKPVLHLFSALLGSISSAFLPLRMAVPRFLANISHLSRPSWPSHRRLSWRPLPAFGWNLESRVRKPQAWEGPYCNLWQEAKALYP